jgi:restriction endonuclease S subunit
MTDWPVKTLGEVCDFVRGVTYDKADARSETKSGFIPLLRATNITEKGLLREDFVFIPSDGVRADQKLMSGDALITIASGSASVVGRSVLVEDPGEMTFGAFCGVLRPSPKILPRYLSHFMSSRSVRTSWSEAAQGTNINNLKRDDILQTECLLPPLEEQKRIIALLDAATARVTELTTCYEQARTHANNLFTSALRDALKSNPDWPVKTLGEILTLSYGKPLEPKDRDDNGAIPVYGANGVKARSKRSLVSGPSIIVGRKGSAGELNFCDGPFWPLDVTYFVEHDVKVTDLTFLHYLLSLMDLPSLAKGVKPGINRNDVYALQSPMPPLEEQRQIVTRLDLMKAKTSEMVAAYDAKLQAAKDLRQSVLESAFAGEL